MRAETVGFMTVGVDRNINLSCRFPRVIDTNQEFNVNQDLRGASQNGTFTYQARIRFFSQFLAQWKAVQLEKSLRTFSRVIQNCINV